MATTGRSTDAHPGFRFIVSLGGSEATFTECTLPTLEVDVLEQKEGGYNQGVHLIAGPVKAGRLTLKRGVSDTTELLQWYLDVAQGNRLKAERNVSVVMLDSEGKKVLTLQFIKAYPVKWTGPTFKTSENTIAIESLELAFSEFTQS